MAWSRASKWLNWADEPMDIETCHEFLQVIHLRAWPIALRCACGKRLDLLTPRKERMVSTYGNLDIWLVRGEREAYDEPSNGACGLPLEHLAHVTYRCPIRRCGRHYPMGRDTLVREYLWAFSHRKREVVLPSGRNWKAVETNEDLLSSLRESA